MTKIIGFSTGCVYRFAPDLNEQITILRKKGIRAVELLFARTVDLDTKIDSHNLSYLKDLAYLSLHTPFYGTNGEKLIYTKNSHEIIAKILKIVNKLNVKKVIVHPNLVKSWDVFLPLKSRILIENMQVKSDQKQVINQIETSVFNKKYQSNHFYQQFS